eukprot:gene8737-685_t
MTQEEEIYIKIFLKQGVSLCIRDLSCKKITTQSFQVSSDPYVVFKAGKSIAKSSVISKNLNPVWNEDIKLNLSKDFLEQNGILEIEVWDRDLLKSDDYMGRTFIILEEIGRKKEFNVHLEDTETGDLIFDISTFNFEQIDKHVKKHYFPKDEVKKIMEKKFSKTYKGKFEKENYEEIVDAFSDFDIFKQKYLNRDWIESYQFHQKLTETKESRDSLGIHLDEIIEISVIDETKISNQETSSKNIKVKLVFVDHTSLSKAESNFKSFISPFISAFGYSRIGLFHTALVIGPWLIEWNTSEICVPRKCTSSSAFLTADIFEIDSIENFDKIRDKLAYIIFRWNFTKKYSIIGGKVNRGNCQEFIESILNFLDIKFQFNDPLHSFLQSMRLKGESQLVFKMKPKFIEYFTIKFTEITFKTHVELDEFVTYLLKVDENAEQIFPDEFILLKSFDRAFWLKNNKLTGKIQQLEAKIKKCEIFIPLFSGNEQKELRKTLEELKSEFQTVKEDFISVAPNISKKQVELCPFGNPDSTGSFFVEKVEYK